MGNIKGLYFKLNMDSPIDSKLYLFFENETKRRGISKIVLLYGMMFIYRKYMEEKQ